VKLVTLCNERTARLRDISTEQTSQRSVSRPDSQVLRAAIRHPVVGWSAFTRKSSNSSVSKRSPIRSATDRGAVARTRSQAAAERPSTGVSRSMSAVARYADSSRTSREVREVPKTDTNRVPRRRLWPLLDLSIIDGLAADRRMQPATERKVREATYLASFNLERTSSMLKVAAFCRGGKSLNVARNWPTYSCAGTKRKT
jgi:hypothetical protein